MIFGPVFFGAPWVLAALISLPIIWWLIRALPPPASKVKLPSLRLLMTLEAKDSTLNQTPWPIILLRIVIASLIIFALAQPIYAPRGNNDQSDARTVLLILDDGWTSAPYWSDILRVMQNEINQFDRDSRIYVLQTAAPKKNQQLTQSYTPRKVWEYVRALRPMGWMVEREAALAALQKMEIQPDEVIWFSDGLDHHGKAQSFLQNLRALGDLSVYYNEATQNFAISDVQIRSNNAKIRILRADDSRPARTILSARKVDGLSLLTHPVEFATGETELSFDVQLPPLAMNSIAQFRLIGTKSTGAVWLVDSMAKFWRIGINTHSKLDQPLLSEAYYIKRALSPYAELIEGEVATLVAQNPDAIILTDQGTLEEVDINALEAWIKTGGVLIRFAGPLMAQHADRLLPVNLRRSERALGGVLAWGTPQFIAPFPVNAPYADLIPPDTAHIRKQVLAEPDPGLADKVWARISDGTPLVTAKPMGQGQLVLFHVTASSAWSDLPFEGVFVDMLRRTIASGLAITRVGINDSEGTAIPLQVLDGYGQLQSPDAHLKPLDLIEFTKLRPGFEHPAGFYETLSGQHALNAGSGVTLKPIANWPSNIQYIFVDDQLPVTLSGYLVLGAMVLILIDMILALYFMGTIKAIRFRARGLILVLLYIPTIAFYSHVHAQSTKAEEAARSLRFAYVETGDSRLDRRSAAGLRGLTQVLFERSSVEADLPHAINLEEDIIALYPFIYYALPSKPTLSVKAQTKLRNYLQNGGVLVIDTRNGGSIDDKKPLRELLEGFNLPPLRPLPLDHVLTHSFYLLDTFPGRYGHSPIWIEDEASDSGTRRDGTSSIIIGHADWAGAWAIDETGRPLLSVDGGERQREMARRFGINLVMHILTGNYKKDQVHLPALLERWGESSPSPFDLRIPDNEIIRPSDREPDTQGEP